MIRDLYDLIHDLRELGADWQTILWSIYRYFRLIMERD